MDERLETIRKRQQTNVLNLLTSHGSGVKAERRVFMVFQKTERASLVAQIVKNLPAMKENQVWSLGQGRSPGEGNGYPLQCFCLENSMERGAWWVAAIGGKESDTTGWLILPLHFQVEREDLGLEKRKEIQHKHETLCSSWIFKSKYKHIFARKWHYATLLIHS